MDGPHRVTPATIDEPADSYRVLLLTRDLNGIINDDLTLESDFLTAWDDKHQADLVKSWVILHADCVPTGPLSEDLEGKLNGDEKRRFHVAQVEALKLKLAKAKASGTVVAGFAGPPTARPANLSAAATVFSPHTQSVNVAPMRFVATVAPPKPVAESTSTSWVPDTEKSRLVPEQDEVQEESERWGSSPTTRAVTPSLSAASEPEPGSIEEERLMLSKFVREMSLIFGHHQLNEDKLRFEPKVRMWARQNRSIIPTRKGSTIGLTSEQKRRLRIAWDEVEKMEVEDQRVANAEWAARFG